MISVFSMFSLFFCKSYNYCSRKSYISVQKENMLKTLLSWKETLQWPCTLHLMTNPSSAAASEMGNLQAERVQWMQLYKPEIYTNPGSALSLSPCLGLYCSEVLSSLGWSGVPGQKGVGGACPCYSLPCHPFLRTWAQPQRREADEQHEFSCCLLRGQRLLLSKICSLLSSLYSWAPAGKCHKVLLMLGESSLR